MILYALSCGFTFTFLYYIFLKDDFTFSLKSFLIFTIFATTGVITFYFKGIPNFIILAIEPILMVILLKLITKRKYFDIILFIFIIHLLIFSFKTFSFILFFAFNSFVITAKHQITIATVVNLLVIPNVFIFKKYITILTGRIRYINKRREEKMIIIIMMLHLSNIISGFVYDHYNSFNSNYVINIYYAVLIIVFLYLFIIFSMLLSYIHKNKRDNLELFNSISEDEQKNILAATYSSVHDARNVLQSIYFENISGESKYENIESKLLTSLLESKMTLSKNNNIEMILENKTESLIDFNDYSINELDFTIILGILIDNAVEHLKSHEDLDQKIRIVFDSDFNVSVSNQIDEYVMNNVQLFESFGYTSKEDSSNSGYGLYNAINIAKDSNTKLNMNISDSVITYSLMQKKKNFTK